MYAIMMMIIVGAFLGCGFHTVFHWYEKKQARKNMADWYPTPTVEGRVTYIDIGKLTSAQAAVLLETVKGIICQDQM